MRVLLIHQAFVGDDEAGGTRHYELGQRLAAHGDHLTVIASQVGYLTGKAVRSARRGLTYRDDAGEVAVVRAYAPAVRRHGLAWRVWAFVVFMVTSILAGLSVAKVDLVMGTTPPIFQAVSALGVARLRRRPFLLEVRDLWPAFAIEMGVLRNPILIALSRRLERFLYRRADHLLVNSPAYRDHLLRHGVPPGKVSFVPNGVDVAMFDPAASGESFRRRYGLEGKCVAIYAGAHGMANDLDTVLDAAERLRDRPDIQVVLVGDGKERPRLEAEAVRRKLANVTFTGPIAKAAMGEVLAAADLCVATLRGIPMFATTYPNKVFDYMAAGRPTLLAIDGVIREVVEAAGGGIFVAPGDGAQMAAAAARLADDPDLRRRMGAAARHHVEEHFNRDRQAEEFRALVRRVAGAAR